MAAVRDLANKERELLATPYPGVVMGHGSGGFFTVQQSS